MLFIDLFCIRERSYSKVSFKLMHIGLIIILLARERAKRLVNKIQYDLSASNFASYPLKLLTILICLAIKILRNENSETPKAASLVSNIELTTLMAFEGTNIVECTRDCSFKLKSPWDHALHDSSVSYLMISCSKMKCCASAHTLLSITLTPCVGIRWSCHHTSSK